MHGDRLRELAQAAGAATDPAVALATWQQALTLLPRDSQQHQSIKQKVADLTRTVEANTAAAERAKPGGMAAAIASSFVFLLKGFFVPITLGTMILSVAVYWSAMGWEFAIGFVVSIYIHEMGHVAALKRYGMAADPPIFIPGLGALIRLKSNPADARHDARMGLAGPIWGLGSAIACLALWQITGLDYFSILAKAVALLNLFNLLPIYPIDGGRGFRAMSRGQQWIGALALIAAWGVSFWLTGNWRELITLLAVVGIIRAATAKTNAAGDAVATWQYVGLVAVLTAIWLIPGPNLF
jgi:Zn-dependent protease